MQKIKLGFVIMVAVVMLYAGVSWFAGMRAQSTLAGVVDRINQRMVQAFPEQRPDDVSLEIIQYQRGVFISTVRYALRVQGADDAPLQLEFQDTVHHGPFPWERVRRGDVSPLLFYSQMRLLPTPMTQPWFDVTDGQPVQIQTRIAFSQDITSEVHVAPITFQKGHHDLQFSGGQVTLRLRNGFADGESAGSFAALTYTDGRESVKIRDISLTGQAHQREDVAQTESLLNVTSLAFTLSDLGDIAIENFGIDFVGQERGDLMDVSLHYRAGKVTALGRDLGAFELGSSAKRIDVAALRALVQVLQSLDQDDGADENLLDTVQIQVHALLEAEPVFAMDPLRWATDKGESRMVFSANLFAPDEYEDLTFIAGPEIVRQADLTVEVSRAMVLHVADLFSGGGDIMRQMLPMLFDQYVDQLQRAGLVRMDGDMVGLVASYRGEDERVELNGQPMSLDEFVMRVMRVF